MIPLYIEVPSASFRKSYARSLADTYPFPPPATVYGMLLSLVGEWFRSRHLGVQLAFAYKKKPLVATNLRKLSRYKYGVPGKQAKLGNAPDFIEILCDIEFICWVDSSEEIQKNSTLETRLIEAIQYPQNVERKGIVSLGLSDDAVNDISLVETVTGEWYWLTPSQSGEIELPVWVDHIGSINTRWQRYDFEKKPSIITEESAREKLISIKAPTN